ncbi:MAG: hypothetical protein ACKO45_00035 [Cyanobium sp.]
MFLRQPGRLSHDLEYEAAKSRYHGTAVHIRPMVNPATLESSADGLGSHPSSISVKHQQIIELDHSSLETVIGGMSWWLSDEDVNLCGCYLYC